MTSVNIDEMMKVILRLKKKILVVMKQRDAAIEEARIACESRDAAIEEARIANKSRDVAIEEARIANESREAAIEEARDVATEKANMVIKNSLIDLETLLAEDQVEDTKVASVEETEECTEEETEVASVEETEVVEKEYDGVTYYLDPYTNELYNNEMNELVGSWDAENNKPILFSEEVTEEASVEETEVASVEKTKEDSAEETKVVKNWVLKLLSKNKIKNKIKYKKSCISIKKPNEPEIEKFKTFEEVTTFYKYLKKHNKKFENSRGPNRRKPNDDGFHENTIRSLKKVMSVKELYKCGLSWGLSTKHKYRLHTCYSDTSDKSTLEYWLIFYK